MRRPTPFISITHVYEFLYNKYAMACICSRTLVCMYALACMLCLIWGCAALVIRRQEALVAPSWARSCLTIEECCWVHSECIPLRYSTRNSRIHTHIRSYKHLQCCQGGRQTRKHTKSQSQAFDIFLQKACVCVGEDANTSSIQQAASLLTVSTAVTCGFPGGPGPL